MAVLEAYYLNPSKDKDIIDFLEDRQKNGYSKSATVKEALRCLLNIKDDDSNIEAKLDKQTQLLVQLKKLLETGRLTVQTDEPKQDEDDTDLSNLMNQMEGLF